jgi:hypothetical protein
MSLGPRTIELSSEDVGELIKALEDRQREMKNRGEFTNWDVIEELLVRLRRMQSE